MKFSAILLRRFLDQVPEDGIDFLLREHLRRVRLARLCGVAQVGLVQTLRLESRLSVARTPSFERWRFVDGLVDRVGGAAESTAELSQ